MTVRYNSFKFFLAEIIANLSEEQNINNNDIEDLILILIEKHKEQWDNCHCKNKQAVDELKRKILISLQNNDVFASDTNVENSICLNKTGEDFCLKFTDNINIKMIKVKAGTFMMGRPEDEIGRDYDDEKLHKVTLTQDYWLGKFPVTQAQFHAIMKYNPSNFSGSKRPVEKVDWDCARDFCVRLNKKFEDKLPKGYQFDLPTEAQWEYACRAGRKTAYFWGNSCNGTEANCYGHNPCGTTAKGPYLERTTDVGTYEPNDWGFMICMGMYGSGVEIGTKPTTAKMR